MQSTAPRDGLPIARTPLDFVNGRLLASLNVAADGQYVHGWVWTGADRPAERGTASETCNDWLGPTGTSTTGVSVSTTDTFFASLRGADCADPATRLYCLEP